MSAISNRQPEVYVHYNTKRGRVAKHFTDAYAARRWYVRQHGLGNQPSVSRSPVMSTETTTAVESTVDAAATQPAKKRVAKRTAKKTTTKKASPKVSKKKAKTATKKSAKKTAKADRTSGDISNLQIEVLKILAKSKSGLTRAQISENLGGKFIGGKIMGHVDPSKTKPTSLAGRKMVKLEDLEEVRATVYTILAPGRKAIS